MIETPGASSTDAVSSGTSRGLRGVIPVGGQQPPKSCVPVMPTTRLEW